MITAGASFLGPSHCRCHLFHFSLCTLQPTLHLFSSLVCRQRPYLWRLGVDGGRSGAERGGVRHPLLGRLPDCAAARPRLPAVHHEGGAAVGQGANGGAPQLRPAVAAGAAPKFYLIRFPLMLRYGARLEHPRTRGSGAAARSRLFYFIFIFAIWERIMQFNLIYIFKHAWPVIN